MLTRLWLLFLPAFLFAQPGHWPGASYDPAIPTVERALGYPSGDRISTHSAIVSYYQALAAAAPERFEVFEFGETWEGRKLIYAVAGSAANVRRLDEIKDSVQALADPRNTSEADARRLIADLPAIVWLSHSVHGNEISGAEASMLTAYHLLAATGDPVVDKILQNTLVILCPMQNPDGRDRFINGFRQSLGLEPQGSPLAAEHDEPWPGGRTNHYLFDLNRDWISITQPEIRGQVRALRQWLPLVFVDLHEMGSNSTYYFAPEAVPYNPHITAEQREALEWFGRNNAKWFDAYGFQYFTREVFDAFYPGYGASWPIYYGAVAMTYEQASARGLVMNRTDQTALTYRETVQHHFVAGVSTAETAADHREELLRNFWEYGKTALEEGRAEDVKAYLIPRRGDTAAVDKLAAVLHEQGVEILQTAQARSVCETAAPAGSYLVSLAQRAKRYVRNMLDLDVEIDSEFINEQERRRAKDLGDQIYDVTAWSLPAMYNLESIACKALPESGFEPVAPERIPPGKVSGGPASVAYLVPWGTQAATRFLTAALRAGLSLSSSDKPIEQAGRSYPRGTLILEADRNGDGFDQAVVRIARESGAEAIATATGWVEDGVNFGSRNVFPMPRPNIALGWDKPTRSYSAGQARFVIEREYQYPTTPIRIARLAAADLAGFDVLILPDGAYGDSIGKPATEAIARWVKAGGVLIAIGGAASHLAKHEILAITEEKLAAATDKEDVKDKEDKGDKPGEIIASEQQYLDAIQPKSQAPDAVPGVIVKARLDPDHWITAGYGDTVNAIHTGRAIFTPIKLDKGVNAARYLGPDELLVSGYLWEENRKQLAYKPLVLVQSAGKGFVIGFTADPNFRAYLDGMNLLLMNAIFRGAAHASPQVGPTVSGRR